MEHREPGGNRRDRDAWVAEHMLREDRAQQRRRAMSASAVGAVVGSLATLAFRAVWELLKWALSFVHIGH